MIDTIILNGSRVAVNPNQKRVEIVTPDNMGFTVRDGVIHIEFYK